MIRSKAACFPYVMEPVADFDARREYCRFRLPGVGISFTDGTRAEADVWRDRSGNLVARLSSSGYTYSSAIYDASGRAPADDEVDGLDQYLLETLHLWLIEGVDDDPTTEVNEQLAAERAGRRPDRSVD
jgi:hypothetical protein